MGTLRGAGNTIVPQVAAAFIRAYLGDECVTYTVQTCDEGGWVTLRRYVSLAAAMLRFDREVADQRPVRVMEGNRQLAAFWPRG